MPAGGTLASGTASSQARIVRLSSCDYALWLTVLYRTELGILFEKQRNRRRASDMPLAYFVRLDF
jgi:hypothetical protein